MRNVAAAVLAVPVLAVIYLPVLARRSIAVRIALVLGIGLIVALGALGLSRPAPIAATAPAAPITALADDAFRSIGAATDLKAPVHITFSQKMDPTSVAGTLVVSPATPVNLAWDAAGTTLTISPRSHWQAATYHTISLDPGALGASGRPMSSSVRAAFVTRPATSGKIAASQVVGETAPLDASFRFTFDRPVETTSLTAALRIAPALDGKVEPVSATGDTSASQATSFVFRPTAALAAGTTYKISTEGLVDADGATLASAPTLTVSTIAAAHVVRFRPVDGSKDVDPRATLSVRFSTAMKHATTSAAVTVTANGKAVAGAVSFAEGNTVVVFKPKTPFLYNAKVVMRVAATATTVSGTALAAAAQTSFTAAARPAARAKPPAPAAKAPAPTPKPITTSGGGAVGGGSWGAVETYYLKLMNCTRTGGWVTSTGSCSSPGGRNVAALRLDSGISTKVSRPYAKKLAVNNLCTHFSGGNPGNRLSAAGYTSYIWAENLGCRSGNPYSAVLGSHLFFQSEKSYNGGHYVNLMNAKYDRVGIGVWVSGGRVRLVIDFYHPR